MPSRFRLFLCITALFITFDAVGENIFKSDPESVKRLTAQATKAKDATFLDPKKVEFIFDQSAELKSWLRETGEFQVEGWVKHTRLRCATYRLGVRFGIGKQACANVNWITEPVYLSKRKQCNQVVLHHKGIDKNPVLVTDFDKITCAQLLIKCTGVCN